MKTGDLTDLIAVSDARKRHAEARFAEICRRETQLRGLLHDLGEQFRQGLAQSAQEITAMQGLGAHQAWVDFSRRRRADINRDLAQVMSQKLECREALRQQMGQRDALRMLQSEALKQARRNREARALERILDGYMVRDLSP